VSVVRHPRRWRKQWRRRPRVALLLALALLVPLTALAALTGSSAVKSRTQHEIAGRVEHDATHLGSLMQARALVVNEYVPSSALTAAAQFKITPAQVMKIFHIDYPSVLHAARKPVDQAAALRSDPTLVADVTRLRQLRPLIDQGKGEPETVRTFFETFEVDIDNVWRAQFQAMRDDIEKVTGKTGLVAQRVDALANSFTVLMAATGRAQQSDLVVNGPGTPASAKTLIEANGAFAASTAGFPSGLGPRASAAWRVWLQDPKARAWEKTITETVNDAMAGRRSPLATDQIAYGVAFTKEPTWLNELTAVTVGASTDMSDVAHREALLASRSYRDQVAVFVLSVLLAAGATVLLARAVVRPLRRLAAAARRVAEGDFDLPQVKPGGPREVADTIKAVDEMTSVFAAVEAFTVTLAEDPDAASLDVPLPGRTGRALQTTLNRLRESVRHAERQRVILHEMATHDSLTGLLNRQAARTAMHRELARARREEGTVMTLFVDLDNLKTINDSFGHQIGDEAIRLTGQALRASARESDIVARIGGDEFLVAGPVAGDDEVQGLADRLREAVAGSALCAGTTVVALRCSIGAACSTPADDVDALVHKADQALYAAKTLGRDRTAWHQGVAAGTPS
jgi:diguanylate cyclase (GGDEF)-like protein